MDTEIQERIDILKKVIVEIRDDRHGYKNGMPPPLPPGAMPAQIGYGPPSKINPEVWGTLGIIAFIETGEADKIKVDEIKEKVKRHLEMLKQEHRKDQTIEIECPPGPPRPGDLIKKIVEGSGLPLRKEVSRSFGLWTWDYSDLTPEEWAKAEKIIAPKLKELYAKGIARYISF